MKTMFGRGCCARANLAAPRHAPERVERKALRSTHERLYRATRGLTTGFIVDDRNPIAAGGNQERVLPLAAVQVPHAEHAILQLRRIPRIDHVSGRIHLYRPGSVARQESEQELIVSVRQLLS